MIVFDVGITPQYKFETLDLLGKKLLRFILFSFPNIHMVESLIQCCQKYESKRDTQLSSDVLARSMSNQVMSVNSFH